MKQLVYLCVLFIFFGCANSIDEDELKNLNGYWEINQVIFPNGETKDFTASPTVDYIELDGLTGYRKKVQPKFDGTFETSADAEYFLIEKENNVFQMHYNTRANLASNTQRTESLVKISADSFSVINTDTLTYTYKRFQPINISK